MSELILRRPELDAAALRLLFSGEILALIVPGYLDRESAARVGGAIAASGELERYNYEVSENGSRKSLFLGVSRYGVSFSTTFGRGVESPEASRYYAAAPENIKRLRRLFSPQLSPIDRLRLELDELCPEGANVAAFQGTKMFTGIARVTHPKMDLQEKNPHVDSLPPGFDLDSQFSANIYLTVPEQGGELVVYEHAPLTPEQIDDFETNQKLWESDLGPGIAIKPEPGDLIIIDTRRPHATKKFDDGTRVAIQTFIGRKGRESLKLWC